MQLDSVIEKVHSLVLNNLPIKTSTSRKGWRTFNCAMCSDTRGRAGVKQSGARISYHCFNCHFTTGWSPGYHLSSKYRDLLNNLHCNIEDVQEAQLLLLKYAEELDEIGDANTIYSPSATNFKPVDLPKYSIPLEMLPETHPVRVYATERGIYGLHPLFAVKKTLKYKDRLLIPYLFNNEVIGWTSRLIYEPPNKSFLKYLNESPSDVVFNIDQFAGNERECVIVTEGIIDAIAIDGISILSNEISPEQAHMIGRLNKRVILCPDQDEAGKYLTEQAIELGWEVSIPPWENCKDAAKACEKYGRLLTVASIMQYATDNPVKAQVQSTLL